MSFRVVQNIHAGMAKVLNSLLLLLFIYCKEIQYKKSFGNRFFLINFKITCKYKRCPELKSLWNLLIRSCGIEKIEDLKTQELHKPSFISRYHNFPAITGANNAWNLIWGYFKAVVAKLLWPSTPSRVSWNFIKPPYFTFHVIVIKFHFRWVCWSHYSMGYVICILHS